MVLYLLLVFGTASSVTNGFPIVSKDLQNDRSTAHGSELMGVKIPIFRSFKINANFCRTLIIKKYTQQFSHSFVILLWRTIGKYVIEGAPKAICCDREIFCNIISTGAQKHNPTNASERFPIPNIISGISGTLAGVG